MVTSLNLRDEAAQELHKHWLEPPSEAPAVIQPLEPSRRRQSRVVPKASHLCIAPRRLAELLEPHGGSEGGAARLPLQLPRRRGGGGGGRPCSRPCNRPAEQRAPGMCRVCAWQVHGVCMAGCATCVACAAAAGTDKGGSRRERPGAATARRAAAASEGAQASPPPSTRQCTSAPRESPATAPGGGRGGSMNVHWGVTSTGVCTERMHMRMRMRVVQATCTCNMHICMCLREAPLGPA